MPMRNPATRGAGMPSVPSGRRRHHITIAEMHMVMRPSAVNSPSSLVGDAEQLALVRGDADADDAIERRLSREARSRSNSPVTRSSSSSRTRGRFCVSAAHAPEWLALVR